MWKKLQDEIALGKQPKIQSTNLRGLKIVIDESKFRLHTKQRNFINYLNSAQTFYGPVRGQPEAISGDLFHFNKKGNLIIKGQGFAITNFAIYQIFDCFDLSFKQVSDFVTNGEFIDCMNKLFMNSYDTKFYILVSNTMTVDGGMIVGFHNDRFGMLPDAYGIFTRLLKPTRLQSMKTSFAAAVTDGHCNELYLSFGIRDAITAGVNIVYSHTARVKPSVNSIILCDKAIIINKRFSSKINPKSMGPGKYVDLIETLVSNIKAESTGLLSLVSKSQRREIDETLNKKLKNRVKKSVGSIDMDFLGMTLFDAIMKIDSIKDENQDVRRKSMFLGDVLTF